MNGSLTMADGTSVNTWSFNNGGGFNGDRTVPSPLIEAIEGQTVQITLNVPMMSPPHTIHPHGLLLTMPNSGQYTATVDYFNIRRKGVFGTATTLITVV